VIGEETSLSIINPIHHEGWNDLLLSTPEYSFFHSSQWAKVLSDTYGYIPHFFCVLQEEKIVSLIPIMGVKSILTGKRGVSLPFSDYCEPFIGEEASFHGLFNDVVSFGKDAGWEYIEFRGGAEFFHAVPSATFYTHILEFAADEDQIFSKFRESTQRNVRKAERAGLRVRISDDEDSMDRFYRLNCLTRKQHGLPPQPHFFFKKIYDEIIKQKMGFVALATLDQKTIAGAVFFQFGEKALFKYGAFDRKFQSVRANNAIMWEAIRWHLVRGYRSFSFGRTDPDNNGLRQFKLGWGTREEELHYFTYDLSKNDFVKGRHGVHELYTAVGKKLPVPVLKVIGSAFYKHLA
jgi:hypothetical protein